MAENEQLDCGGACSGCNVEGCGSRTEPPAPTARVNIKHMIGEAKLAGNDYNKAGMAYVMSKNFVVWYAQKCAHEYAKKGIRVVSVSPGLIETDMGNREVEQSDFAKQMIDNTCAGRMGKAQELGYAIATIADERNGYLCGIDVLIDGGASTGKKFKKVKE